MNFLATSICLILLLLARSFILFQGSLRAAKQTGLPYVCLPLFADGPFFRFLEPFFHFVLSCIPARALEKLDHTVNLGFYLKDWRFKAKYEMHRRLGDVFLIVSPGVISLEVADPQVCAQVVDRRTDFIKNSAIYSVMRIFGHNIVESTGETWKRHRRAITPQYNDAMHSFVWDQSTLLAREMLSEWKHVKDTETIFEEPYTSRESRDLGTLAHRIVMSSMFNTPLTFRGGVTPEGIEISEFSDSMKIIVANIVFEALVPRLLWPFFPRFKHVLTAATHLDSYLIKLMDGSTGEKSEHDSPIKFSVLDGLKKALVPLGTVPGYGQLSLSEVMGNMFILNLAGTGTVSDTIHFAMILLALHPEVQSWITEELDQVVAEHGHEWKYQKVYPKLLRLSCLMMETVRLFPPVTMVPKVTNAGPQTITYQNHTYTLPQNTMIGLSSAAIQYNPAAWGPDAAVFRPDRWLSGDAQSLRPEPVDGCFVGFSRGSRKCLGKRFAGAEFTAVMAEGLRRCRVELAPEGPEETEQMMRERALRALENSTSLFTLHAGGRVRLRFVDRF